MSGEMERGVESVSRALDLLESLAEEQELGLSELARRTGLRPSTTHRQLGTLAGRGYVQRNPETGHYMLGYRLLQVACCVERRDAHLRLIARPFMRRIRRVCGETTNLAILEGADIVYIEQLPGKGATQMFAEPGRRIPAHATAAGKAMMAFIDHEAALALLNGQLRRFTEHTITTPANLVAELSSMRARGYAMDFEEYEHAVSCVAAPIFGAGDEVLGALSVSGPTARLGGLRECHELGELIGSTAIEASRELGYRGEWHWHVDADPGYVGPVGAGQGEVQDIGI